MKYLLLLCALSLALAGCRESGPKERKLILPSEYSGITTVMAQADCSGPEGTYRTVSEYAADGYSFFQQNFDYQQSVLRAVVLNDSTGYVVNQYNYIQGPLAESSIQVVKGHEFQLTAARPQDYFTILNYRLDTAIQKVKLEQFMAVDHRDNPVYIYYNRKKKRIERIHLLNIKHKQEQIEVIFSDWRDTQGGPLPFRVQIHQEGRSDFFFQYSTVRINDPVFQRIVPLKPEY